MSIQQIAEDHAKAWSPGDAEQGVAYYRPDGVITINRGDPIAGRDALLEIVSGFHAEFPGMILTVEHLRTVGNQVMFGCLLEGKYVETGKQVSGPGWDRVEFG